MKKEKSSKLQDDKSSPVTVPEEVDEITEIKSPGFVEAEDDISIDPIKNFRTHGKAIKKKTEDDSDDEDDYIMNFRQKTDPIPITYDYKTKVDEEMHAIELVCSDQAYGCCGALNV